MAKMMVANHKMNMDLPDILNYIAKLKQIDKEIIICPTAIYAPYFIKAGFTTGLQNIYYQDKGAYTGEISAAQAKSLGAEYVIIGHSERRDIFKETNQDINKKIQKALEHDLKVILCLGEHQDEDYHQVLAQQLQECLAGIDREVIIAYEPVWAIGTGLTPTNEQITQAITYIKSLLDYDVKILYGGSVNSKNIEILNAVNVVSGYLIGGASTKIDELIKISEVVL